MAVIARNGQEDAGSRCEELLQTMDESGIAPDYVTLTTIVDAWTHAKEKNAAYRCHAILRRMKYLCEEGREEMKSTVISCSTVIKAYAKCGMAEEAERVLLDLLSDVNMEPTVLSFSTVIDAFAKKGTEEAAVKSTKIWELMLNTAQIETVLRRLFRFPRSWTPGRAVALSRLQNGAKSY